MTQATFDRWLLGAAGLVALLVGAGLFTFQNTRRLNEDARWVAHTHEVRETLESVGGHLRQAEALQRTFLIIGGDTIPAEFSGSIRAAGAKVQKFKELTGDNQEQQERLPELEKAIAELTAVWTRTMTVRQTQGFDAARKIVEQGHSRQLMTAVQDHLRHLDEAERGLLHERAEKRAQTYRSAMTTGAISGVASVAGVVAFMMLLRRHLRAQRAAAAVIAEQGERLRTTLASIGDGVITTDTQGRITSLNPVAEALTGWTQAEAAGQRLEDVFRIVNEETRQAVKNPATTALSEGVIVGLANHTVLLARNGVEVPIDDSAAPIRCKDGAIVGCVLVFRDVTQRRRLEKENTGRLAAARLLASIVESSDDAIVSKSLEGIIQSWNAAAERIFGYTAAEAVGRHISFLIPADRLSEEDRIIASLKAGQRIEHYETVRVRRDGRPIHVSLTISPVKDDAGQVIGASKIVRDITDRHRAEAERQKFVTLVENSTDFIGMCDLQGMPFFVNRAGLQMVGLDSLDQACRTPVRDYFFPEDQPRIMNEFFPSVREQGHGEIEVRFRHFKTGAARWMAYKVLTLTDAAGQALAFATVSQDVTERRQLEDHLRKLAADLSEADRRKDEFLATLAHELRNPLAPIRNALQIIRLASEREARERARTLMERQLVQMVRLVDDLLDVSRITRGKLELRRDEVPLATVLGSAVETSRPLIDQMGHTLTVTLPEQEILLDADLTRLAQVFANLLNNSAKYMDRGGHIWLSAEIDDDKVTRWQGDKVTGTEDRGMSLPGPVVKVSVKDAGIGIAADHLPRIFDMFAQVDRALERAQGGLGIGLTLVKRLVEMHGGRIEAQSDGPGQGSEFIVRLPVATKRAAPRPAAGQEPPAPTSALRILIVDDNRDSADSLAMLLQFMGNETRTAYDGQAGVDCAEAFRPAVVLLDIGLPKLNGYEACRHLRGRPWGKDVVLIAVTGWGQEEDRRHSREAGFDHHMVKPVDPQELMRLLADLPRARRETADGPEARL